MPKFFTCRGVPRRIAQDGWWLGSQPGATLPPPLPAAPDTAPMARAPLAGALMALVLLADLLFWRHEPGLSVAVFAAALFLLAGLDRPRAVVRPALLLVLGAAPVVELVQPLSVAFLIVGLSTALVWLRHPQAGAEKIAASALGFLRSLPRRWLAGLDPRPIVRLALGLRAGGWIGDWAFPLGGTLVFAGLILSANPMLARLLQIDPGLRDGIGRPIFWLGTALLVAPFLARELPLRAALPAAAPAWLPGLGLNARSVLRALVLFNLLIAVQMVTDLSILVAGAALPPGMDYAEYAHRGAYPLLATAILAGAFALAAHPFRAAHPAIRPLLLLWLGQNVVLCGAAALRLDLYVAAYGITHLRLYAFIWMALVAAGLALTAWQQVLGRSTRWLLLRAGALGLATLYACCFVNFAAIVATQNLQRDSPDLVYICHLGPMASGAIEAALPPGASRPYELQNCPALAPPQVQDWRDWGFRSWRVIRKVRSATAAEATR